MKKLLSVIIYVMLAAAVVLPLTLEETHAAFSPRTTMPEYGSEAGNAYYYTDDNVFYKNDLGPNQKFLSGYNGYCVGNCTWYAYGRVSEILGTPLNTEFRWSASSWWDINQEGNYYSYGSTPKVGAIACYSSHVAVVEEVVEGQPYVSESGWTISSNKPENAAALKFHYGAPWQTDLKGYIYVTEEAANTATTVDYSIQIDIDDLNMRSGPGTGFASMGYAQKGTYKVDLESGMWARLADSGYWVCLNYVSKVSDETAALSDGKSKKAAKAKEGVATNYKVRVATKNLNMRTGPGKKYKSMGCIKPGKYTIIRTKNGWGKVKNNGWWIKLSYTKALKETYKVKVSVKDLNMRKGPGASYERKGYAKRGVYTITKTSRGWGKLKKNGYWIKLSYTKKI